MHPPLTQGPEPEGVALGSWSFGPGQPPRRLLFLALERTSLIAAYDLSNPTAANPSGERPRPRAFLATAAAVRAPPVGRTHPHAHAGRRARLVWQCSRACSQIEPGKPQIKCSTTSPKSKGTGPVFQAFGALPAGLAGPEGVTAVTYTARAGDAWPVVAAAYEAPGAAGGGVALYKVVQEAEAY